MKRRNFIKTLSAVPLLNQVELFSQSEHTKSPLPDVKIRPERLKKGDTIGLVTPGSYIRKDELEESIENISNLGFKVVYTDKVLARDGYFGGTDEERAADLNNMFARKDVDGIFATRGGYGCTRILPLLDYKLIAKNPKVFVGYSDITALLYGIYKYTGLVCFHGPVGISTFNEYSLYNLKHIVLYPSKDFVMYNSAGNKPAVTIKSGKAKGELIGGNLSLACSLVGTDYDIGTKGKILFLEEVEEEPYRIDRMLTQMKEAGKFDDVEGVIFGVFEDCNPKPSKDGKIDSFTVLEVIYNTLGDLSVPMIFGMSFGHITDKLTMPFGIYVEFDSVNQSISLLETSVN